MFYGQPILQQFDPFSNPDTNGMSLLMMFRVLNYLFLGKKNVLTSYFRVPIRERSYCISFLLQMTVTPMEVDDEVTVDEVFEVRPDICLPTQKNMVNIAIF